jgi:hypothetical protein
MKSILLARHPDPHNEPCYLRKRFRVPHYKRGQLIVCPAQWRGGALEGRRSGGAPKRRGGALEGRRAGGAARWRGAEAHAKSDLPKGEAARFQEKALRTCWLVLLALLGGVEGRVVKDVLDGLAVDKRKHQKLVDRRDKLAAVNKVVL